MRSTLLAVCLVAVGLMAFDASAQAEPIWMVNGANLTAGEEPFETVIKGVSVDFETMIFKLDVKFLCKGITGIVARLRLRRLVMKNIRHPECKTYTKTAQDLKEGKPWQEQAACTPINQGTEEGIIEFGEVEGELVPYEGKGVVIVEPVGGTFGTINMSPGCLLGEEFEVKGKLVYEDAQGMGSASEEGLLHEQKTHTLVEEPKLTALKIGAHEAKFNGEFAIFLSSGKTWSGLLE